LVAAVDRYPDWCGEVVREVEVLELDPDGQPLVVRMRMHIARAGMEREFNLFLAVVATPPSEVRLTRVTDHATNQEFRAVWELRPAHSTSVALDIDAKLRVPWYIPGHGIGDAIADAFVAAACRALGASSPAQR